MEQAEHDLFLFGKDFSGTAENITSDGQIIVCEWNETPLFDNEMNVIGAASFARMYPNACIAAQTGGRTCHTAPAN